MNNINNLMNNVYASMTVIGAGSYGTALSIVLANNGHNVVLWDHNEQHVDMLKSHRSNIIYLPNILLPKSIYLEKNLHNALSASKNILVVVPSNVFGKMLEKMKPIMRQDARVVWATKGLEPETGRLLQDVAREILGKNIPLAVMSGPTFAKELAQGLPTEILLASTDQTFSEDLQQLFHCDESFHVYKNLDIIGIQISGVIKNVIAIAAGISDGIGFGSNARMAIIIRGLNEISRLGTALGAHSSTFFGMAGLGDLILTCTDNQSRNRRFGLMIGQGINIKYAKCHINQVIEGFYNTQEVRKLAQRFNVSMPIIEETYQILYCQKDMRKAISMMLSSICK